MSWAGKNYSVDFLECQTTRSQTSHHFFLHIMLLPLSLVTVWTKSLHISASFISWSQAPSSSFSPSSAALAVHLEEQLHLPLQGGIPQVSVRPVPLHVSDLDLCDALAAPLLFQADPQYGHMMLKDVIAALQSETYNQPGGTNALLCLFLNCLSASAFKCSPYLTHAFILY